MARPKPSARIVLEARLKIPRGVEAPRLTRAQLARLRKAFQSDILASLGIRSDVLCSKMGPSDGRPLRLKR
jgi:hypothetical protein